jgi:protein ImuB
MLWFALHLNALPLEAWLACVDAGSAAARPRCVVEARRVVLADAAARALGVEPGMSAATAASLAGLAATAVSLPGPAATATSLSDPVASAVSPAAGLQVFARDRAREATLVERLALALSRFTPGLVLQSDGVLLEVSASLRLFGGARALWRAVGQAARDAGVVSMSRAAAPTAGAACILARTEPASPALRQLPTHQRLDALPLAAVATAWAIEPRVLELLHGVGCRTLGDVRVLPRAGAHRRGVTALLEHAARAYGEAPDPQRWYEPPQRFEQSLELLHRADDAAALVFATQRLVQPLAGWLAQQWHAAARVSLVLRHETSVRHARPDTTLVLALADPTRDAAQLMLLLRERLQRTELPAPVYALTLRLDQSVSHAGRATALWRERGSGEDARALFDRLAARLGPEGVRVPALVADHRPERAMRLTATTAPAAVRAAAPPDAPRPAWLLPEPQRLAEDPSTGQPLHQGAPLAIESRAERIEAGWFDGLLASRDYHWARSRDRRWLWIYRERQRVGEGDVSHWYLHGVFG